MSVSDHKASVQMNGPAVLGCSIVNRKSLWSYRGEETVPFIKIICAEPKGIPKVKDKSLAGTLS
jgi:DNA polymerase delta subunit 1